MSKSSLIILVFILGAAATLFVGWVLYTTFGSKIFLVIVATLAVIALYGLGPEIGKYFTREKKY